MLGAFLGRAVIAMTAVRIGARASRARSPTFLYPSAHGRDGNHVPTSYPD